MKLKQILPSLKEKKRYLSFEILSEISIPAESARAERSSDGHSGIFDSDSASKATIQSCLDFLGTFEAGKASLMFLNDKYSNNSGVIKANHRYVDKVRTALALITKIDNKDVIIRTRIVSGTLKKSVNKFIELKKQEAKAEA